MPAPRPPMRRRKRKNREPVRSVTSWCVAGGSPKRADPRAFVELRPANELGCLYYSKTRRDFVSDVAPGDPDIVPHYGRLGGAAPGVAP